jgi:galactosamine-6-phosphate isomerase
MISTKPSGGFSIEVLEDYESVSREAAAAVLRRLREKRDLLLCASAGASPTGLYARLASHYQADPGLFSELRVIQIDEWGGLPPGHSASCKMDLDLKLLGPLDIAPDRFIHFDTATPDPGGEIQRVSTWLHENGPIDLCILGLGLNGHVAMNEPGEYLLPRAHLATLADVSRQHAMLDGGHTGLIFRLPAKPTWGLTLGMADIMNSKEILLVVSGARKRDAVRTLMAKTVTSQFPASFLWLHPATRLLCDNEAFGLMGIGEA